MIFFRIVPLAISPTESRSFCSSTPAPALPRSFVSICYVSSHPLGVSVTLMVPASGGGHGDGIEGSFVATKYDDSSPIHISMVSSRLDGCSRCAPIRFDGGDTLLFELTFALPQGSPRTASLFPSSPSTNVSALPPHTVYAERPACGAHIRLHLRVKVISSLSPRPYESLLTPEAAAKIHSSPSPPHPHSHSAYTHSRRPLQAALNA
ncbi:hypothetical protein R3P38DRAFT_3227287 [Favolaschia claudopus]|uniref:Uncharacterized protein n=1 Tax=Favolaschia claudopus TaxID=2862362 RepID=A0AAV9ZSE0_9AGAR